MGVGRDDLRDPDDTEDAQSGEMYRSGTMERLPERPRAGSEQRLLAVVLVLVVRLRRFVREAGRGRGDRVLALRAAHAA